MSKNLRFKTSLNILCTKHFKFVYRSKKRHLIFFYSVENRYFTTKAILILQLVPEVL